MFKRQKVMQTNVENNVELQNEKKKIFKIRFLSHIWLIWRITCMLNISKLLLHRLHRHHTKKWAESMSIQIDTDSQARSFLEFLDIMEIWTCEIENFNTKNVSNRES